MRTHSFALGERLGDTAAHDHRRRRTGSVRPADHARRLPVPRRPRSRDLRGPGSAALAFEVSARIQAEIEALAWVTAEQKATVDTGAAADVAGWCDGLLVRLEIRRGRMNRWQERAASASVAAAALDATPPVWVAFAERAARQAAALRRAASDT